MFLTEAPMVATAVEEAMLSCAEIVITGRYCTCATIGMLWLATASRVAKTRVLVRMVRIK